MSTNDDHDAIIAAANPAKLKELLLDKGSFITVCDDAMEDLGGKISSPIDLLKALNFIANAADTADVDAEEADDMFLPDLTLIEFRHLAQNYFSSLATTLDEEDNWGGLVPKNVDNEE